MTDSTASADQITQRLNTDSSFKDLNGKTINLHTNLKGKIRKRGSGEMLTRSSSRARRRSATRTFRRFAVFTRT